MQRYSSPPPTNPIQPLRLRTLGDSPSWHNRAGRVDRSACFVLSVSWLWRLVPDEDWLCRPTRAHKPHTETARLPDRIGQVQRSAYALWQLHRAQPPRPLQGDRRTRKSNAMRTGVGYWELGVGVKPDPQNQTPLTHDPINPNRGVGFSMGQKVLGLPSDWSTIVTIERYPQHARLKQHFLVCPVCGVSRTGIPACHKAAGQRPGVASSNANPHDSTPASDAAAHKHAAKLPGGRVTKLYLPLCTQHEYDDAQVASLWLRTIENPNRPHAPEAIELIKRYAELFPDRRLRCRQCLGLRYGEVK